VAFSRECAIRSFCETYYAWFLPSRSKSSSTSRMVAYGEAWNQPASVGSPNWDKGFFFENFKLCQVLAPQYWIHEFAFTTWNCEIKIMVKRRVGSEIGKWIPND
jgi:hypothetical protein